MSLLIKPDKKIGFIGGGNMAFAIASGLLQRHCLQANQICVSGPHLEKLERWHQLNIATTTSNAEILQKAVIIFLCIKPHQLQTCVEDLRATCDQSTKTTPKIIVSVLAGITLNDLEERFNFMSESIIIRCMPNTSLQVGEGCTVYSYNSHEHHTNSEDILTVNAILNALGKAECVAENLIDCVTGLSGCGPAYVYTIIEAMADGAVRNGVPRQMALQFAAQTVMGAAKTVLVSGKHPAVLRDEVCSPGGATIVGVHELEKGNLRSTLMNAVVKASLRCQELGKRNH